MKQENTLQKKHPLQLAVFSLVIALMLLTTGCAAFMAARQPEKRDLSVLNPGTPRGLVVSELGPPTTSDKKDGERVDIYSFKQGYSTTVKVLRVMWHVAADVFTAFLWEFVGMPIEMVASGTNTSAQVTYDEQDNVKSSTVFHGR